MPVLKSVTPLWLEIGNSTGINMTPPTDIEKIGVFGGTFDPIHNGHLAIAEFVRLNLGLDRVIFVVASDQWLRQSPPQASATDRFNMVELAVRNRAYFSASDVDIVSPPPGPDTNVITGGSYSGLPGSSGLSCCTTISSQDQNNKTIIMNRRLITF